MTTGKASLGDILAAALSGDAAAPDEDAPEAVVTFEYVGPPPVFTQAAPAPLTEDEEAWAWEWFDRSSPVIAAHYGLDEDRVAEVLWDMEQASFETVGLPWFGRLSQTPGGVGWAALAHSVAMEVTGLGSTALPPPMTITFH